MPNHKFITTKVDDARDVDDLLFGLNAPGAGFWVTDEEVFAHLAELLKQPAREFDVKTITGAHGAIPVGYLFGPKGGRMNVSIRSPQTLDNWGLSGLPVNVLRAAFARFEDTFDVWISGAPSTTGLRMIEKLEGRPSRPADMSPFEHNDAQDFIWTRPLTDAERGMQRLHAYDKRMSYLYSSDINLGVGEYVHETAPVFDKNKPGIWRIKPLSDLAWLRVPNGLPFPATNKRGWYYTPMIALIQSLGIEVEIAEAYTFPNYKRVLHDWVKVNVGAIKTMGEGDEVDRAVVKMAKRTFRQAIGLFGGLNRKDKTEWSYRPDWRGMIIADASARIYYGMLKARKLTGQTPAAIYCDCLYYPSDDPNPKTAAPFLTDEQLSKGYHYEATYDISGPDAKALFESERKLNFAEKIQAFEIGGMNG